MQVSETVRAIESEIRRLQLWASEPPTPEAMSSRMPFCYDTLSFAQWLQWVLLPRMCIVLEQRQPLPTASDIWPLAEEAFAGLEQDTTQLLQLIRSFDKLINKTCKAEFPPTRE